MESIQEDVRKALNRAYFYLKFRPRSEHEVRSWLAKKSEKFYHWNPEVIDAAIDELKRLDLIDDRKFIESFVTTRNIVKPKGVFALKQELMKAGVAKDLIDEYFAGNLLPDEELAKKALEPRWRRYSRLSKKDRFEKAAQFLMRRGFSFSLAKKVIEKMD